MQNFDWNKNRRLSFEINTLQTLIDKKDKVSKKVKEIQRSHRDKVKNSREKEQSRRLHLKENRHSEQRKLRSMAHDIRLK